MENIDIEKKINDTLASISQIEPASPRPFMYTRIMAKIEGQSEAEESSFFLKPAMLRLTFTFAVLLSVASVYSFTQNSDSTNVSQTEILSQPNFGSYMSQIEI